MTRFLVALLLGSLLLAACGESASREARLRMRFLEEAPHRVLELVQASDGGAVTAGWTFEEPGDLEGWSVRRVDEPELRDGGLLVPTRGLRLETEVPVEAARSGNLRIRIVGELSSFRLYWASEGEDFSRERRVDLPLADLKNGPPYVLDLSAQPGWTGAVERLRLDLSPRALEAVLQAVELGQPRYDGDDLAAKVGTPWLIDLDHDVRPGFLTPPGVPAERALTIPQDGRLRAAVGFAGAAQEEVRFVATFRPDDGGDGEDGDEIEVGSVTLPPAEAGWRPFEADLASLAGRSGTLLLDTDAGEGFDLAQGTPVWAGPQVWGLPETETGPETERPPNLVLVSADTLRADHLELYGYPRETAPRLTRWARERGVTFLNTVTPAPWTLPAHTSMLSGLNPLTHGVNYAEPVPGSVDLLAEKLRRAGYHTVAYTGSSYLHPYYGLAQGFDRFRYWPIVPGPDGQGEDLEGNMPRALEELAELPEPFFLFFHTYEVHDPYHRREPYYDRFLAETEVDPGVEGRLHMAPWGSTGADVGFSKRSRFVRVVPEVGPVPLEDEQGPWIDAVYDSGISFLDEHLGRLFDALEDNGLDERTVTVFTSDHGEALGEAGLAGHFYLYDHNLMVPLVIVAPGVTGGDTYEPQVRLEDLTPTLLELLEQEVPAGLDGVSLTAALDGRVADVPREAWSYAATRNFGLSLRSANRLKMIYNNTAWSTVNGDRELYDLVADPGETEDLATEHPQASTMAERLVARLRERETGLSLTLKNDGEETVRGVLLSNELISKRTVKGAEVPAPGVVWEEGNTIAFTVPSGSETRLVFETARPGSAWRSAWRPRPRSSTSSSSRSRAHRRRSVRSRG